MGSIPVRRPGYFRPANRSGVLPKRAPTRPVAPARTSRSGRANRCDEVRNGVADLSFLPSEFFCAADPGQGCLRSRRHPEKACNRCGCRLCFQAKSACSMAGEYPRGRSVVSGSILSNFPIIYFTKNRLIRLGPGIIFLSRLITVQFTCIESSGLTCGRRKS